MTKKNRDTSSPELNTLKVHTVFKALIQGHTVKMLGDDWCLAECGGIDEGSLDLAIPATDSDGQDRYLRSHVRLGDFIKMANSISDEEATMVALNITLNQIKGNKWKERRL